MPYHVRNRVPIQDLRKGKKQAARQEDIVLQFFERHPNEGFTPLALHRELIGQGLISVQTPETSIRRAMTDLTKCVPPILEKRTDKQRLEKYGSHNSTWWLIQKSEQLQLILTEDK